jgi:hypothetical protein
MNIPQPVICTDVKAFFGFKYLALGIYFSIFYEGRLRIIFVNSRKGTMQYINNIGIKTY